jgi:hypothetical protein
MRELHLQPAFCRRRALAEDLEDQSRAVDDLALELFLEVALLDRAERAIDDDELGLVLIAGDLDVADLTLAKQRRRPRLADRDDEAVDDLDTDREGEPLALVEPRFGIPRAAADFAFQIFPRSWPP